MKIIELALIENYSSVILSNNIITERRVLGVIKVFFEYSRLNTFHLLLPSLI